MKVYCLDHGGLLAFVIDFLTKKGLVTENYHEADALLTWQDVRGDCKEIAEIFKLRGKPVIVVQHGRGATRDYLSPNSFPAIADMYCLWGQAEKDRLLKAGVPESRITLVGCPRFQNLLKYKKVPRSFKNILFVPVIADREQPENLLVYSYLKRWECNRLAEQIQIEWPRLKTGWATQINDIRDVKLPNGTIEQRMWKSEARPIVPRYKTYERGLLNVALSSVHDMHQYLSPLVPIQQSNPLEEDTFIEALTNTDIMVCLEEGTTALLACAIDIPVVYVDIFKYGEYGGTQDYDRVEKISTNAVYRITRPERLDKLLNQILVSPRDLTMECIEVVKNEAGGDLALNATANIVNTLLKFKPIKEQLIKT